MTSDPSPLDKAPIREAILDVWVEGVAASFDQLRAFGGRLGERFGPPEPRKAFQGAFHFNEGSAESSTTVVDLGFLFRSDDGLDVIQARVDGFTVNRLRPYASWTELRAHAKTHWPIFVDAARPESVKKVGLRYINQFELPVRHPLDGDQLAEYFLWRTTWPTSFGTPVGFFGRTMFQPDEHTRSTLTLLSNDPVEGRVPFLLDIEVQRAGSWEIDDAGIWSVLDNLRDLKNSLFFGSITPRLKERFE
ncbi:MAG: TIGR04255 family protein [Myxococcales bacterium]|nr:TIGR04255 family protein [Myxococcales bacterium]